jgi:hypothetical protein
MVTSEKYPGGGVNDNLLDNADWRHGPTIVSQLGSTFTAANGGRTPVFDRWNISGMIGAQLVIDDDGLHFALNNSSSYVTLWTILENPVKYAGKTLTFSVQMLSGAYYTTVELPATMPEAQTTYGILTSFGALLISFGAGLLVLTIRLLNNTVDRPLRAKLEIGMISTLLDSPPQNYANELQTCQRYLIVYPGAIVVPAILFYTTTNTLNLLLSLPVTMRTPVITGTPVIYLAGSGAQSGFTFTVEVTLPTALNIRAAKTAHGISVGAQAWINGPLTLNAQM